MSVTTIDIISLPDGVVYSEEETVRPVQTVIWTGGSGPFDVKHEWDTVSTFDSGDLVVDDNIGVTSPDHGVPPSDLGGEQTWFYQVTITDHGDEVNEIQRVLHDHTGGTFTLSFDGQGPTSAIAWNAIASVVETALEALSNITDVTVVESATGDWLVTFVDPGFQDVAMMTADGALLTGGTTIDVTEDTKGVPAGVDTEPPSGTHTIIFKLNRDGSKFLYLLKNIIPGFAIGETDDSRETPSFLHLLKSIIPGFGIGEPDDARETPSFFHLNKNITTLQPCPFFENMAPTLVEVGAAVLITGDSFGATQATWDTEVRLYEDGPALSGSFILLTPTAWADDEISVTVPAGAATGWVTLVQTNGSETCPSSGFKLLQIIQTPPDPDAGWWLLTADKQNAITATETFIPADTMKTSFKTIMNAIGSGRIEMPLGDPQIADFIDPVTRKGVLVRTYLDNRFRYAWFAQKLSHDYDEEGNAIAVVTGPGMEVVAEWAKVLPHDFPASPTKNPTHIYGSTTNLVRNGSFEDGLPILQNPGGEDGNDDDGNAEGWNLRGKDATLHEAVQAPANALEGDWFIRQDADDNHSGIQQSVTVTPGKVYHVQVRVKDPGATGMRLTLALGGGEDIAAIGITYPENFAFGGEILAELDNVARAPGGTGLPGGSTDGTWQVMDVEVLTGPEQTSLSIAIQNDHHQSGIFNLWWLDSVTIEGWGLGLDPWVPFQAQNHATSSFRLDTTTTFEGSTHSLKMNAIAKFAGFEQLIQVTGLTKYTASIRAFTSGALGDDTYKLELHKNDGDDTFIGIADEFVLVPGWNQFQVIFTTDNITEELFFRFVYSGPNNPPPIYLDSASMVPGEPPSTAGKIMNDLLDQLALDNQLLFLGRTFTDFLDSKGVAWPSPLSMDINPGESIADVLARFVALGHEWEIVPVNFAEGGETGFELNLYTGRPFNPGSGIGINWTTDPEGPVIHPGDATIGGRVVKTGFNINRVFAIGDDGTWSRVNQHPWLDADQEVGDPAPHGYLQSFGSIEEIISVSAADGATISQFADSRLAEEKDKEQQLQLRMQRSSVIRPFLTFNKGDSIYADMPPYNADPLVSDGEGGFTRTYPKRVRALTANLAGEGADIDFDVDINRVLYEDELAWFAAIAQLAERSPADNTGQGTGRAGSTTGGGSVSVSVTGTTSDEVALHTHDLKGTDIKNRALTGDVSGSLPGPVSVNAIKGNAVEGDIPADVAGDPVFMIYDRGLNTWVPVETSLAGSGGLPLTSKGDIHTYSTVDAELAVGADGKVLMADAAEVTGLKWNTLLEADISDLTHTDVVAIHDNVASEISAIAEKTVPVDADLLVIEDSAASNVKKRVQIGNLPGGPDVLTTKGDLHGFDTDDNRLPVGTNTQVLTADSAEALGVKWAAAGGAGSKHVIQDEGVALPSRDDLNFAGTGVTATDALSGADDYIVKALALSNLYLHWTMDDVSGDLDDTSGNGRDGTAAGDPVYEQADSGVAATTKSILFDGVGDIFSRSFDSALIATVSVIIWYKGTDTSAGLFTLGNSSSNKAWDCVIDASGIAQIRNAPSYVLSTSTYVVNDDAWHMIVLTRPASGTMRLYVDGAERGTVANGTPSGSPAFELSNARTLGQVAGLINLCTVIDREITSTEVTDLWDAKDIDGTERFTLVTVPGVTAFRAERITTDFAVADITGVDTVFNSIIREDDPDGHFSYSTSTGIMTINTTGWYHIEGALFWEVNATGTRFCTIQVNGTDIVGDEQLPSANRGSISTIAYLTATDAVTVEAFQSSGGSLNVRANPKSHFTMHKL